MKHKIGQEKYNIIWIYIYIYIYFFHFNLNYFGHFVNRFNLTFLGKKRNSLCPENIVEVFGLNILWLFSSHRWYRCSLLHTDAVHRCSGWRGPASNRRSEMAPSGGRKRPEHPEGSQPHLQWCWSLRAISARAASQHTNSQSGSRTHLISHTFFPWASWLTLPASLVNTVMWIQQTHTRTHTVILTCIESIKDSSEWFCTLLF